MSAAADPPLLRARGIEKSFGGVHAVRGVDLDLPRGRVRAIIGPNGAGKTTLVSVLSGRVRPDRGRIHFDGTDITRTRDWRRAALGIVYTFQVTSIFRGLTCAENVGLAVQRRMTHGLLAHLALDRESVDREVRAGLARVGLAGVAGRRADTLPYGHQRLLELAITLALGPRLLILDEPTQGLSSAEVDAFCALVRDVSREVTVLLIEHNVPVVLELADTVTVMDRGAVIAEGPPAEIGRDAEVQRAYLGS